MTMPTTKPKAIICDLDGTLALMGDRSPHDASTALEDALNHPIANILEVYSHQKLYDIRLLLVTGRQEKYRGVTEQWLQKHQITHYEQLYMRPENDQRKDYVLKREIYERDIRNRFEVLFVLEDRDQVVRMWRGIGLTCLQVEYGDY